jgi:hypothetical protein
MSTACIPESQCPPLLLGFSHSYSLRYWYGLHYSNPEHINIVEKSVIDLQKAQLSYLASTSIDTWIGLFSGWHLMDHSCIATHSTWREIRFCIDQSVAMRRNRTFA